MPETPADRSLRVLYVLFRYPQLSQTFVRDEVFAVRRAGLDVAVVTLEPGDGSSPEWAGPVRLLSRPALRRALRDHLWHVRRDPRRWARYVSLVLREPDQRRFGLLRLPTEARAVLAGGGVDRLHTHFAWSTATLAAALGCLVGASTSITTHAKDLYTTDPETLRRRLKGFDDVVTVCNFNVGYLAAVGGVAAFGRVRVVPCGVTEVDASRDTGGPDVLTACRLVEKKGVDVLLRACAAVRRQHPGVRVEIIGDGSEAQALKHLSADLGIDDAVHFHGALAHDETLRRIGSASVFCLAARPASDGDVDAMPVVLREAMARSVPVVSTALAGIPESVDAEVGWLVAPDDERRLADALLEALGDTTARRERGVAAQRRARTRWTFTQQAQALLDVWGESAG